MTIRRRLDGLIIAIGVAAFGCAEPVHFAEWTLQVPTGVPVHEYEVRALDSRGSDSIEIVPDLVIGDGGDGGPTFYRPQGLVVDEDGRIYVLDSGNHRVLVFAPSGELSRSLGRQGQGPGELDNPRTIMLVEDGVLVNDFGTGRLNVWSREGEYVTSHEHLRRFMPRVVLGDGDTLVAGHVEDPLAAIPLNVVTRFATNGDEIERIHEVPIRGLVRVRVSPTVSEGFAEGFNGASLDMRTDIQPRFALSGDGKLYLAAGDEYQLLAVGPDGGARWALRASLPMPAMPMARIDAMVEREDRTSSRSDYEWDDSLPAIESIRVDGHGHVWVYPTVPEHSGREWELGATASRPVDVYSPDGELLFSGLTDSVRWEVSFGDYVYQLTRDHPQVDETVVVRYVLVEPF